MAPGHGSYDVVIIGGGMHGSGLAWWLTRTPGFQGRILVVERDPSYEFAATGLTNSCIRQQFTTETNIRISQFGADFIHGFRDFMQDDTAPEVTLQNFGYLYLADTPEFAQNLATDQKIQAAIGAATRHMTREEIAERYPFFALDNIVAANHNTQDEGYFDGGTIFDWFRRKARAGGVEYLADEVTGLERNGNRIDAVILKSGARVSCGTVVNASGTRAAATARMAGLALPVEPRKRYTYIFDAADPLEQDLPLTIDPSGVHMRTDGRYYMAGCAPEEDGPVDVDDFTADHTLWEDKVWPIIATRVPSFERIKLVNMWVGHYDYNTLDQNAILGPHPEVGNFIFCNGFSGHGLQQAPAVGRGLAEWITYGAYRSLDLGPLGVSRVVRGKAFLEKAVI